MWPFLKHQNASPIDFPVSRTEVEYVNNSDAEAPELKKKQFGAEWKTQRLDSGSKKIQQLFMTTSWLLFFFFKPTLPSNTYPPLTKQGVSFAAGKQDTFKVNKLWSCLVIFSSFR